MKNSMTKASQSLPTPSPSQAHPFPILDRATFKAPSPLDISTTSTTAPLDKSKE